jgi:protein arginine N-methyltransferase 1
MGSSYSLADYGVMIVDRLRTDAYARALRQAVEPGAIVVDIGTGTGGLACLACQYGAKKVYAIEPDDAIEVAREVASANGFADRIQFIQELSPQVTLPEQADVIVSDLGGVLPLFQHHIPSIIDARSRFLKRGGTLIPRREVIWVAAAAAPELYERHVTPWERNGYGLDMQVARRIGTNEWRKCRARPHQLLLEPRRWTTLDFPTIDRADVSGELSWSVSTAGTAHGLILWFDADLGHDIGFSNAPGAPEIIYGQAFFPWSHPVTLAVGDTVSVSLKAALVAEDYVWCWDTRVLDGSGAGWTKADFRQSTFFGVPLSPSKLAKRSADYIPSLTEAGRVDRLVLESLDAHMPLGHIADQALARFPNRFASWEEAMTRVAELSAKYSQ